MAEATMPAIGTRAVHKDDHAKGTGPVWHVTAQDAEEQKVKINHLDGHKLNKGLKPEVRQVTVGDFDRDYRQL